MPSSTAIRRHCLRVYPLAVRLVVQRCLEKDPSRRYDTATEVRLALEAVERRERLVLTSHLLLRRYGRRLAVGSGLTAIVAVVLGGIVRREQPAAPATDQIQTVAVLPLANVSNDPAQDYFTDGMTETLIGSGQHRWRASAVTDNGDEIPRVAEAAAGHRP